MADARPLQHLGFALARTPALPMREWLAHAASPAGQRAASARVLFGRPLVEQAIHIASPSFHARLKRWDWTLRDADDRKMLASFERYLNRMCFRATPFGLFSTVSHAPLVPGHGRWTLDQAAGEARIEPAARIDGEALGTLCNKLHNGAPDPQMRYVLNASLYRVGDGYRFIDWRAASGGDRAYALGEIDGHPIVDALVERLRGQVLDRAAIAALVQEQARAEDIDLPALVDDLIAARILLPSVSLDPLHPDPGGALAAALSRHPSHAAAGAALQRLNASLRAAAPDCASLEHYMAADRAIRALSGAEPAGLAVQVDGFRAHPLMAVDAAIVDAAVGALDWLMDRFSVRKGVLDEFAAVFEQRYGGGMVPLMEALDPEAGVGFGPTGITDKLTASLGIRRPAAQPAQVTLSPLDQLLLTLIQRDPSLLAGREIEITRADAGALPLTRDGNDGNGMMALLRFPWMSRPDHARACTAVLAGMDAEGSTSWISRFGHGDGRLSDAARAHARDVERQGGEDVVHAEIAYLPKARAVNVLSRACVWSWRINLAEPAIEPGTNELPVSDLLVRVHGKDIELWSRRLGKRVIPHLTAAHRSDDPYNPAAYRFLCALGWHGMRIPRLAWGTIFRRFDYLPRLRFESLVLTTARWRVRHAGLPGSVADLRALLARRGVPRYVELEERDNRLILDLDDTLDVEQLLRIAKKGRDLVLLEVLEDLDRVRTPDAALEWRHELVVPLHRPQLAQPRPAPVFMRDLEQVPLAEALYVKLYGGQETLDKRVLPQLAAWIAQQRRQGALANWFFIRYAEHGWHLRLRVFPVPGRDQPVLADLINLAGQLQQGGWISRFEFAPYQREMIRYGGAQQIAANESLFGIDSDLAAEILSGALFGDREPPARWAMAVLAIDALLNDAGLPLDRKLALATRIAASFKEEFRLAGKQLAALGDWYRGHAREVLSALRRDERAPPWSAQLWQLLDSASPRRRALAASVCAADPQLRMLESQVHMLCNRLFMAQNREFEVLVYDVLARAYRALAAMAGDPGGRHGTN